MRRDATLNGKAATLEQLVADRFQGGAEDRKRKVHARPGGDGDPALLDRDDGTIEIGDLLGRQREQPVVGARDLVLRPTRRIDDRLERFGRFTDSARRMRTGMSVLAGMKQPRSRFLLAAGALLASAPVRTGAQAPPTIRFGLGPNDDATAVLYASEKGLFAEPGSTCSSSRRRTAARSPPRSPAAASTSARRRCRRCSSAPARDTVHHSRAGGLLREIGDLRPTGLIGNKNVGLTDGAALNDHVVAVASLNSLGRVSACAWVVATAATGARYGSSSCR